MSNLCGKSEQHQNDLSENASLHNQSLNGDSLFAVSHDQVFKCEPHQWDVKPDLYLQVKQDLTQDFKSELHQEYQEDIVMASSKEDNGL